MGVSHKPIKKKNYKYQFLEWFSTVPIITRKKSNGLYLQLSSLITLGKRLCVVSAQVLYNVLAGSYQAQARTALEVLPSLEAERVAGLSKHIT
ncbi:TPA: hypothetical protein ACNVBB_001892 [Klebsiella aerogenes]|uniref:hypothetical protein n=1 Tax=Klebsiella aerogenes TaxID=548 RepID=UPI003AFD1D76